MPPQGWFNDLDHETRIRIRLTTDNRGKVITFTLQLEFLLGGDWLPAVRYDTAHGEAHIDLIDPSGVEYDKRWLGSRAPYNSVFTRYEAELKESAAFHRNRFFRSNEGEAAMTASTSENALLDPDIMFTEDIIANPGLAPQLSDPHRVPTIKAYAKGTFPDRPPDISTPRTDVYIVGWEDKDPNDPFWQD